MFNFFQQQKQQGYARPLHPHHWQALAYVRSKNRKPQMELMEFLKHWEVSREELSRICNCSVALVGRWFTQTKNHMEPSDRHKELLAEAHQVFLQASKRSTA